MTTQEQPTELATLTPEQQAVIDKKMNTPLADVPVTMQLLMTIQNLPSIPEHYQGKPKEMMTAIILGREVGVQPMTSINNIDLIDGTVSLRAKLVSALIHRKGHVIVVLEQSATRAAFKCMRYHPQTKALIDVGVIEFTIQDAELAGLLSKKGNTWEKYPKSMLTNRCLTLAARTVFADALMGFAYTAEELGINEEYEAIPAELEMIEVTAEEGHAVAEVLLDGEIVE